MEKEERNNKTPLWIERRIVARSNYGVYAYECDNGGVSSWEVYMKINNELFRSCVFNTHDDAMDFYNKNIMGVYSPDFKY